MADSKTKLSRRHFLLAAGAGGAGAAAAMLAKNVPQPLKTEDEIKGPGYQASEHVRNYYRTTKV
ncbi:MAG: twin-arginine translocation signal domain-containing protein [Burkholderiales bacterium]